MNRRKIILTFAARCRAGFTLVELLVVVGVIAVLISLLLPALSKAMRAARAAQCLSNLRQIATAMVMYAQDNKGAVPGVVFNAGPWNTYNALPYDCRPYQGYLYGYPSTPAGGINPAGKVSWYSSLGLLCFTGYMEWSPTLFCPGRDPSDPMSWDANTPNTANYKTSGGYNPGWKIDGNGFATNFAGYLVATSTRSSDKVVNFGKSHRLGACYADTPLAMDVFWWGEGALQEGHGQGYNIASFDGSARWYPDPGYSYQHSASEYNTAAADVPKWPVEILFQGPAWGDIPRPRTSEVPLQNPWASHGTSRPLPRRRAKSGGTTGAYRPIRSAARAGSHTMAEATQPPTTTSTAPAASPSSRST